MVDFQSRDTSRGYGNNEETEDGEESETSEEPTTVEETPTAEENEPAERESDGEATEFGPETFPYAVVSVGKDQTVEEDTTGSVVVDAIEHDGDTVVTRELVEADYDGVQSIVGALTRRKDVEAIVTVGGTGVSPGDVTIDAVEPLFDKGLPGFGELYRVLSHDFDGTAVIHTRATAGIIDGIPIFCLPGDTEGARRGVEQIVLEEAETIAERASPE